MLLLYSRIADITISIHTLVLVSVELLKGPMWDLCYSTCLQIIFLNNPCRRNDLFKFLYRQDHIKLLKFKSVM